MRWVRRSLAVALGAAAVWWPQPVAGQGSPQATVVAVIDTSAWSPPSPDPTGVAYSPARRKLIVADAEVEETSLFAGANAFEARRSGSLLRAYDLTGSTREPAGVAVPPRSRLTLFVSDDNADRVFIVRAGEDRRWGTRDDRVRSISTRAFGSQDPEGLAFGRRSLFVADGSGAEIFRIRRRGPRFDGPPPDGDDAVSRFDTASLGLSDPEGVDYDPVSGHLFIVSRRERVIVEVTLRGRPVAVFDVSSSGIEEPSGVAVVRPDPGTLLVYVADRGADNNEDPAENDGRIFAFSISPAG
ncbi:MAG TPA: SdiA-regulated domain-containing protein [Actinomycetota bacterium]|nr:SdiA-regulated domain-containing protein [Actinomycetota bacterium]